MAYWHQDENGKWYFDWSHLVPLFWFVAMLVTVWFMNRGKE